MVASVTGFETCRIFWQVSAFSVGGGQERHPRASKDLHQKQSISRGPALTHAEHALQDAVLSACKTSPCPLMRCHQLPAQHLDDKRKGALSLTKTIGLLASIQISVRSANESDVQPSRKHCFTQLLRLPCWGIHKHQPAQAQLRTTAPVGAPNKSAILLGMSGC